jgi:hypothetical protein
MNFSPEIRLLKGFGTLHFGQFPADAIKLLGEPEETQTLEDDILETSSYVLHYWSKGISLFFDNHNNKIFNCVEVDNTETLLFGKKIFDLREKEIIELMKENGFKIHDSENHEWGEKRVSFDEAGLDCYFENHKLVSVNFGMLNANSNFYYFPN